jgi:hypothetical protein
MTGVGASMVGHGELTIDGREGEGEEGNRGRRCGASWGEGGL